jgi:hypothetical protein
MQTSMPRMKFESAVWVFEREKTVHTLDHPATIIGMSVVDSL